MTDYGTARSGSAVFCHRRRFLRRDQPGGIDRKCRMLYYIDNLYIEHLYSDRQIVPVGEHDDAVVKTTVGERYVRV